MARFSWDLVTADTIQKCFKKCGFYECQQPVTDEDGFHWDDEDLQPLLPPGTSLQDFVNCDNDVQTGCDTEDDLQQAVPSTCIDETEDSENMDDDSEETVAETSHQTSHQHIVDLRQPQVAMKHHLRLVKNTCVAQSLYSEFRPLQ